MKNLLPSLNETAEKNIHALTQAAVNSVSTVTLDTVVDIVAKNVPRYEQQIRGPLGRILVANILSSLVDKASPNSQLGLMLRQIGQSSITMAAQPISDAIVSSVTDQAASCTDSIKNAINSLTGVSNEQAKP